MTFVIYNTDLRHFLQRAYDHAYRLVPMARLSGLLLLKWGQWQSFLKMPHDERPAIAAANTMYLIFFMSQCFFNNCDTKDSHTGAYDIGKQIAQLGAAPGKYGQLQDLDYTSIQYG